MASSNELIDLEHGDSNGSNRTPSLSIRSALEQCISSLKFRFSTRFRDKKVNAKINAHIQIEDYVNGYPRFAALMSAHDSFSIFRRFSVLRTRLLLLAQDKITVLEESLNKIDKQESSPLFLACTRKDRNANREAVISEIQTSLAAYGGSTISTHEVAAEVICVVDQLIEGSRKINTYESAPSRLVSSLQNWHRGNACISRNETAFLEHREDLFALAWQEDGAISWLGEIVPESLVRLSNFSDSRISRDPRVHVLPRSWTTRAARIILAPLIIFLLLAPVIICNFIVSLTARLILMVLATSIFVTSISMLTKAKTVDLAVAGATYTTVLIVFISGPSIST